MSERRIMNTQEKYTPIALFTYNRPSHTRQTVEALLKNPEAKDSLLYIFADGPKDNASDDAKKKIAELRSYIHTISGFKDVIIEEADKNKGLANSIIYGVTKVIRKYGQIVVVEDDVVTSSHFLHYINQSLELYKNDDEVICINGASFFNNAPIKDHTFFQYGADCQGWATWKRGWDLFNSDGVELLNTIVADNQLVRDLTYNNTYDYINMLKGTIAGKIDSWAIKWLCSAIVNRKLCLYPSKSLVQNIGFDSEATNTKGNKSDYELEYISIVADETTCDFPKISIEDNLFMRKVLEKKYRRLWHVENKQCRLLQISFYKSVFLKLLRYPYKICKK